MRKAQGRLVCKGPSFVGGGDTWLRLAVLPGLLWTVEREMGSRRCELGRRVAFQFPLEPGPKLRTLAAQRRCGKE